MPPDQKALQIWPVRLLIWPAIMDRGSPRVPRRRERRWWSWTRLNSIRAAGASWLAKAACWARPDTVTRRTSSDRRALHADRGQLKVGWREQLLESAYRLARWNFPGGTRRDAGENDIATCPGPARARAGAAELRRMPPPTRLTRGRFSAGCRGASRAGSAAPRWQAAHFGRWSAQSLWPSGSRT
jgi:hypothetical protein